MSQRGKSRGIPNRQVSRLQDPVEPKNVFASPVFNSAMHSEEEIRRMTKDNLIAIDDLNLTPQTQAAVAPKINQKLNFLPDQAVFKGLVPLNVNDSILPPQRMGRKPSKGKNSKENIPKTAEPELRDYVQLVPPMTMIIPEPVLRLEYKPEPFNFLEAYKKLFK
ncbi:uncharacterized protein LOC117588121 [Drosophila guanche]|uniref:Protein phosphatase 1 regulatory subunit 35 C-terminal domain-containing protein n=1 Tax=Drosophila guanche TaxID=7266 RepID=A0A3B0KQS1_DROGU|nr:uncharacterized protein LOC117588121 [Drosophila guanche]SPP86228.1 Hypothetical predicted protein [Drosophila guanche]